MLRSILANLLLAVAYTALAFGVALLMTDKDDTRLLAILTGSVAYGFANVHFVLWFTVYTRRKKEAQAGLGRESRDELFSA